MAVNMITCPGDGSLKEELDAMQNYIDVILPYVIKRLEKSIEEKKADAASSKEE